MLEVSWSERSVVDVPPLVAVTMTLRRGAAPAARGSATHGHGPGRARLVRPGRHRGRGCAHSLGCTALEVAEDECCILTDHRLLPLSWTRDAYYQAAAVLLAVDAAQSTAAAVIERHLTWLWRSGRDHDGVWRRSHLSTGGIKDTGYQVDQQLFPLLELADFRRTTGGWPGADPAAWGSGSVQVWRALPRDSNGWSPARRTPRTTPEFPYLVDSCCWSIARRLEFDDELGTADLRLGEDADHALDVIRATFTCDGPFGQQWAYEADGLGGQQALPRRERCPRPSHHCGGCATPTTRTGERR